MARLSKGATLGSGLVSVLPEETVPAGQTWSVDYLSIANTGGTTQNIWLQWTDSSASANHLILAGAPVVGRFKWEPFRMPLVLSQGDSLRARGAATGTVSLTSIVSLDNNASGAMTATALGNGVASILPTATVPTGQTWRVNGLTVTNTGAAEQDLFLQVVNSSEPVGQQARVLAPGLPILPGNKWEPLEGELVLNAGDQLQARGPTSGSVTLTAYTLVEAGTS